MTVELLCRKRVEIEFHLFTIVRYVARSTEASSDWPLDLHETFTLAAALTLTLSVVGDNGTIRHDLFYRQVAGIVVIFS